MIKGYEIDTSKGNLPIWDFDAKISGSNFPLRSMLYGFVRDFTGILQIVTLLIMKSAYWWRVLCWRVKGQWILALKSEENRLRSYFGESQLIKVKFFPKTPWVLYSSPLLLEFFCYPLMLLLSASLAFLCSTFFSIFMNVVSLCSSCCEVEEVRLRDCKVVEEGDKGSRNLFD